MATRPKGPRRVKGNKWIKKTLRADRLGSGILTKTCAFLDTSRSSPGKKGKPTMVSVSVASSGMFNPAYEIAKGLRDALKSTTLNGPIRVLTDRVGEVANLSNPAEQMRSCAAILARKYGSVNQRLRNLAYQSGQRELSGAECLDIFRIVGGLGSEPGRIFVPVGIRSGVPEESRPAEAAGSGDGLGEAHQLGELRADGHPDEPDCLDERGALGDDPDVALPEAGDSMDEEGGAEN